MLAYIPAPWILWDRVFGCLWRIRAIHRGYKPTNVRAFGAPPTFVSKLDAAFPMSHWKMDEEELEWYRIFVSHNYAKSPFR